jgi:hypothetical protein
LNKKRQYAFLPFFVRKYLKNHNIGPRLGEFSPIERLFSLGRLEKYFSSSPHFEQLFFHGKSDECYFLQ